MDAVVLVGGEGTRLRPLTYDIPKQMLPVVDRPMIEHVVAWLAGHGIDRVVLSLGYRPTAFVEAFPADELAGARLAYAIEPELLDTAGAVRFAVEDAGVDDTFLVLNGDVLSDFDVTSLVAFHKDAGAEATIQLTPVDEPSSFGVVPTDASGRVTAFIEKPPPGTAPTNLINAGCYVVEPSVIDRIPTGRRVSIERETFPLLVEGGRLFAYPSESYWLDTGTPAKYLQASLDVLAGRCVSASRPAASEVEPGLFLHADARIAGTVRPTAFVGAGARIDDGAVVSESVVCARAHVGEGARVTGSMVMAGARVEAGAIIEASIIGKDAVVGPDSRVVGNSVIGVGADVPPACVLEAARYPAP